MRRVFFLLLLINSSLTAEVIYHHGNDLQATIDASPDHAVIHCDPNEVIPISTTVRISRPVSIQGLHAKLKAGVGRTPILWVSGAGFSLTDFNLIGNYKNGVEQDQRAALVFIEASDFRVERGKFSWSTKDGVEVRSQNNVGDVVGGVIRDIVGHEVVRDVVSICGTLARKKEGPDFYKVRNVLVENIRGTDGSLRGVVEVSDGSENITVRTVYARNCSYAVDIQDHRRDGFQDNHNIVVQDIFAVDCVHAVRTANKPIGHTNLTVRDVTAVNCDQPLELKNTKNLTLENVRIVDHFSAKPAVEIVNCDGVAMRNIVVSGSGTGDALTAVNCDHVSLDGFTLEEAADGYTSGFKYLISENKAFTDLQVRGVVAPHLKSNGIFLENESESGTLSRYLISSNVATIADEIQGDQSLVVDNIVPE